MPIKLPGRIFRKNNLKLTSENRTKIENQHSHNTDFLEPEINSHISTETENNFSDNASNFKNHSQALRAHIKSLGEKKYWESYDNSPELIICFIPAESLISSAVEADPGLLDYAFKNNVALASPVTLMATLKAVGFAWKQNVVTDDAKKLLAMSNILYKNLAALGQNVKTVGTRLGSAVNGYNKLVQGLNGQIVSNLRKMNDFDISCLEAEPLDDVEVKQLTKQEYTINLSDDKSSKIASK